MFLLGFNNGLYALLDAKIDDLIAIIGEAPIMSACLVTRRTADAWDTQKLFEANIAPLKNVKKSSAFHF